MHFRLLSILTVLLLVLGLSHSSAYAFRSGDTRIEKIPAQAEWLISHARVSKEMRLQPTLKSLRGVSDGAWTIKVGGPTGDSISLSGRGITANASVMSDADAAARFARAYIEKHPKLLPQGVAPSDLELWTNEERFGVRYVSFKQMLNKVQVLGASVYFAFKRGNLIRIDVRAFPVSSAPVISTVINQAAAARTALSFLADRKVNARLTSSENAYFPVIQDGRLSEFKLVKKMNLDGGPNGRWTAYVDAATGELFAMRDERVFASRVASKASVHLRHHLRNPATDLIMGPAVRLQVNLGDDGQTTTDSLGKFAFTSESASATLDLQGLYTRVRNSQGDNLSASMLDILPDDVFEWQTSGEFNQAQIDAYVFVEKVRQFAMSINPGLDWLRQSMIVTVNFSNSEYPACNAWFDGNMTFLKAGTVYSMSCNNTAMLADVVYHEFGHGFHYYSVMGGVGEFDESVSEGFADFMSSLITGDHKLAPYFSTDGSHLRDIEIDKRWPEDIGNDPHVTGLIVSSALWDLRKALVNSLGEEAGLETVHNIFAQIVGTTTDIPSLYDAILMADDDNGDLSDGTPNVCAINIALGQHGLGPATTGGMTISHTPIEHIDDPNSPVLVELSAAAAFPECGDNIVPTAELTYSTDKGQTWKTLTMLSTSGDGVFSASLPAVAEGKQLRYRIEVNESTSGTRMRLPSNPAEPFYRAYSGELVEINCDDFESGEGGWTHELVQGVTQEGADDWQLGTPKGKSGDPIGAYSGNNVWGNDLTPAENWNGAYQPGVTNALTSPAYDFSGYERVRMQFRRWLNVEDAEYDKASVYINDRLVWQNLKGSGDTHHQDSEWILFDADISGLAGLNNEVRVRFEIKSDQGLEFGGWNIDDLCFYEMLGDDLPPVDGDDDPVDGDDEPVDGDFVILDGDEDGDDDDEYEDETPVIDGDAPIIDGDETQEDGDLVADGDGPFVDGDETVADGDDNGYTLVTPGSGGGGCSSTKGGFSALLGLFAFGCLFVLRRRLRSLA